MGNASLPQDAAHALHRIAVYAAGMVRHHEQHGFGEARSWRVILRNAREALDLDGLDNALTGDPLERRPENNELERLARCSQLVRDGNTDLALEPVDAHELRGQLAAELLLWRHSHPGRSARLTQVPVIGGSSVADKEC